jgi:ATP-dependent DNA helicase RecG
VTNDRSADYLTSLVRELCALPRETEWVEFKVNNAEPQAIGEYISALANSAALWARPSRTWSGACEDRPRIVGTRFDPQPPQKGTSRWKPGCCGCWTPKIDFRF